MPNRITQMIVSRVSDYARARRGQMFLEYMAPRPADRILDLGSEDGSYIASLLPHNENVYIADISIEMIELGRQRYGFEPVLVQEDGRLPFPDGYFDILHCNSVIEHVTVDKVDVARYRADRTFAEAARARQRAFAEEISRVARAYWVQTPNRHFPVESHTWLPGVAWLPRPVLLRFLSICGPYLPKNTTGDWLLLSASEMQSLFPDARILRERLFGLVKSIIAIRGRERERASAQAG